ncbi:hypothetical protein DFH09DRAFT_1366426 [Mycena vulgaris]|nr:hypothetical protein DFH09DRAFT_1366426 [Mycena vulgaris]
MSLRRRGALTTTLATAESRSASCGGTRPSTTTLSSTRSLIHNHLIRGRTQTSPFICGHPTTSGHYICARNAKQRRRRRFGLRPPGVSSTCAEAPM